jgi:hypothetical protein
VFFEDGHVLGRGTPLRGLVLPEQAALDAGALPVDTRIGQNAGDEIVDDVGHALFTAEPGEESDLLLIPQGGCVPWCSAGGVATISAIVAIGELVFPGHALAGALVGFATSGGEKLLLCLCSFSTSACGGQEEHGTEGGQAREVLLRGGTESCEKGESEG